MSQEDGPERASASLRERESWLDRFKTALGLRPAASIRDDLEDALDESEAGDTTEFSAEEKRILRNILDARGQRVQDVMVPRGSIIAISEMATLAELRARFTSAGHSRLPVYGETLDDPKGMVHLRDMFARLDELDPAARIGEIGLVRPVLFAPGSMPALDLLLEMQRKRIHMALVIDEYGATDGLISIEDILEIIVGDIEDEHDVVEDLAIEMLPGGGIAINAQAPLDEVEQRLGISLAVEGEDVDIGTIGGYVTAFLGRVPEPGETVTAPNGLQFVILEGDQRRIRRLQVLDSRIAGEGV
ncbi:MAG: hemolysin family protein [Hyphomicrobiales bacterium]|uniref:hemolysin family protein n=1 Tax=Rhabdaerophilum calidifontis TaxID=2604328 RepID=UPI0012392BBA|nr:hemolysin family protein [Rhabdaerophilum calidifontis]MCA1952980.1 hemolysin family protein [Hyphomicrobiales bacterium]MCA1999711.1 hemolysin family protein [Hyphomicrobiales bacterium]